ncbi:hypothetical protein LSG31_10775 [Fodinisporobacter ferrooxydans]|uniref:Signal peptidase I n=1 Tax=Fodinisporobacter ferrooxydans TaxID=2901836 RepID=A0ABY4CQ17_9BACL|nr:hypothetical protein LSG31_10775 [Alicyclobacillaceae bacterium MYW30-H2]
MNHADAGILGGMIGTFLVLWVILGIAAWILQGFAFYKMYTKANVWSPWLAFIPIANLWPFMWTIKKSAWNILWLIIPIVNLVFSIIWTIRLLKAFNMNPLWALLFIGYVIPAINSFVVLAFLVLYCYMGFSSNVRYNPDFDWKPPQPPSASV